MPVRIAPCSSSIQPACPADASMGCLACSAGRIYSPATGRLQRQLACPAWCRVANPHGRSTTVRRAISTGLLPARRADSPRSARVIPRYGSGFFASVRVLPCFSENEMRALASSNRANIHAASVLPSWRAAATYRPLAVRGRESTMVVFGSSFMARAGQGGQQRAPPPAGLAMVNGWT